MHRCFRISAQIIAGLAGLLIALALLVIWRLNSGPIRTEFFTPYIINAIDNTIPGAQAQIAKATLAWDNGDRSFTMHADGITIKNADGDTIADLPSVGVKLSAIGLALGQFLPTELVVDHLQVWLDRKADGAFYFGGVTSKTAPSGNFRDAVKHALNNLDHALITRRLYISQLTVNVHDEATQNDWAVHVPEIHLKRTGINLAGIANIEVTQQDKVSPVTVQYDYSRFTGVHHLSTHFSDITPAFFAGGKPGTLGLGPLAILDLPLTGDLEASIDDDLNVDDVSGELQGGAGTLNYTDFWDKPRAIKSVEITGDYDRKKKKLDLSRFNIDFGGPKLSLTATGSAPSDDKHDLNFVLNAKIDNWPMDEYINLWPKPIIANPREWIDANLSKGTFDHGEASFKGALAWNDLADIELSEGKGKISAVNGTVHYMDGMPPVEGVNATANFDLKQMAVSIANGGVGDLKIVPFTLAIDGLSEKDQTIAIPLKIEGPVPGVLKLIDAPPLGYAKAIGLEPQDIGGQVEGTVAFKFPLLKTLAMSDVDIKADAKIDNMNSTKLLKGIDLSQGKLALALDKDGFTLKGPEAINKVPMEVSWHQNFVSQPGKPSSTAEVTGNVQGDQWVMLGIDAFKGTKGPTALSLQYTQLDKDNATITGALDMTAADVRVDQLDWKKPAGTKATFKFDAVMPTGGDIKINSMALSGPNLDVEGKGDMKPDASGFTKLDLKPMIIGRTNASLHFEEIDGKSGALHFDVSGEAIDIGGLRGGKDPERADPRPKEYRLKVDKLYTSENGFIDNAEGYAVRDAEGWSQIEFHGKAQGDHQLDLVLAPKDGITTFFATCDDFGKALQGLGFTDTVHDGALDIEGESTPDAPRVIEGTIKVGHFSVHDLPVLVFLLNATQPFNIGALVTNSAEFDHMKGKFRWEGDTLQLKNVNASGSAIGINVQGKTDMNTGAAKLNGTIVPFSMVNRILNYIPILGDLITGGSGGGVLAVAYSIGGTLGDPKISVNPVSLLTPGFVRNLFFGGSDDDYDDDKATTPATAPSMPTPAETNINKGR